MMRDDASSQTRKADNAPTGRGRPRDPQLEDRVLDAAIGLYAEAGWAGFSYEALARRSGVGKAGLYARWKSREALLRRTLEARWLAPARIDTGSLRGDLLALAGQIFGVLTSDHAGVARWMPADAVRHPEVEAALTPYREATVSQGRAIVRRAIARGEIAPSVNPGLLMDLVVGGVTNHVSTTPRRLRAAMIAKSERFSADLVDAVLRGVGAGEPISPASS